jgi:hypothetical protein
MEFPIVLEPNQPDDLADVLDSIDFQLGRLGIFWTTPKIVEFIDKLHAAAGYVPPTYKIAIVALSYRQLKAIEKQLENAIKKDFYYAGQPLVMLDEHKSEDKSIR